MSWLAGISNENADNDNLGVDWVLQYEFGDLGMSALTQFIHSPSATLNPASMHNAAPRTQKYNHHRIS